MNTPELPTITLNLADQPFTIHLAFTRQSRAQGYMFTPNVPPDEGMLFIFPRRETQDMWMQNCLAPLDMLFLRDDGTIAQVATLPAPQPGQQPARVRSTEPVRYVLELAAGRANELGLQQGDKIPLPTTIKKIIPEPDRPSTPW